MLPQSTPPDPALSQTQHGGWEPGLALCLLRAGITAPWGLRVSVWLIYMYNPT